MKTLLYRIRLLGVLVLAVSLVDLQLFRPDVLMLPSAVITHIQQIYEEGQRVGNRPDVFSKVGDSITVSSSFLYPVGMGNYDLGGHGYLQPVVDYYSKTEARQGNSFVNPSLAAGVGWAAWGVLNPEFANQDVCLPGETPLACEYRLVRPSVAVIMFGTNDVTYRTATQFHNDMTRIVDLSTQSGVIPILSTIPPQPGHDRQVREFNGVIQNIAATKQLPLIDYHAVLGPLPNRGLAWDNLHPSEPPRGYEMSGTFTRQNMRYGYVVRNVATLQALYVVRSYVSS